jgi:hypothetical protein
MRLGRLEYFRQRELQTGDVFIGDQFDGRRQVDVDDLVVEAGTDQSRDLANARLLELGSGSIRFSNMIFENKIDAYVQCLAEGDLKDLQPAFAAEGYDACIEIPAMAQFTTLLRSSWVVSTAAHLDGKPVGALFGGLTHRAVEYRNLSNDYGVDPVVSADPFLKRTMYAGQREYRVLFVPLPKSTLTSDFISVQIPLSRRLKRIY